MQGLLYSLGIALLGANRVGAAAGLMLLSTWAFIQPVLFAVLLFGRPFILGVLKVWGDFSQFLGLPQTLLWPVLAGFLLLKVGIAGGLALGIWKSSAESEAAYLKGLEKLSTKALPRRPSSHLTPLLGAFRDLLRLPFLISLGLSLGFLAYSGEKGAPELVLYGVRVIGSGLVLFWALRSATAEQIQRVLKRFPRLSQIALETQARLNGSDQRNSPRA